MMRSRRPIGRLSGALVGVLILVLTGVAQAHADSLLLKDYKRDTYAIVNKEGTLVSKPRPNGDITSVRITHRTKSVDVALHNRRLRPGVNVVVIDLVTSAHRRRHFELTAAKELGTELMVDTKKRGPEAVGCSGARARFNTKSGTVRVHIPTRCLGNPDWVRVGAMVATASSTGKRLSLDVAGMKKLTKRWLLQSGEFPLSPRIRV